MILSEVQQFCLSSTIVGISQGLICFCGGYYLTFDSHRNLCDFGMDIVVAWNLSLTKLVFVVLYNMVYMKLVYPNSSD